MNRLAVPLHEAAAMLGVSRWTLWRLIGRGLIRKLTHRTIAVEEINRFVRSNTI